MINICKKISSIPRGVKSSASLFLARVISMGISYITVPIFTRLLTTNEYGQVNVFTSWMSLFGIIAMFGLANGVFNNGMSDYPDKRDEYSFSMLVLSNLITIAFSIIIFALYPFIRDFLGLDFKLVVLMSAIFFFQPAYSFWSARQRYEMKYKALLLSSILTAVLSPVVALIFVLNASGSKANARIFGMECASIAVYIIFYVILIARGKRKVNTEYWKFALLFNLPLIPHYLSMYLLGSSDRLMISHMVSNSATAFYSIANSVASVATVMWGAVNASLVPFTYEHCKKKDYKPVSAAVIPILTVIAGCCVLVIMLTPEVVAILATADYKEAIYAIPPIVGGVFFQTHYGLYANVMFYYKRPKYIMIATVVSAVFNVILNCIFIPIFGFIAAGYTTLFCYFVQAIIDYFAMRKTTGGEEVYSMKHIGALSFGVIAVALLSNFIYDYAVIRYGIICMTVILAFVFKEKIVGILKFTRTKS